MEVPRIDKDTDQHIPIAIAISRTSSQPHFDPQYLVDECSVCSTISCKKAAQSDAYVVDDDITKSCGSRRGKNHSFISFLVICVCAYVAAEATMGPDRPVCLV